MKWMGAGAALAGIGLPACRRVEKYLVPYNEGPEWSVPGVETAYATCLTMGGNAQPVLAACYEGRPVKLIPSLQYPEGPGLPAAAQASILDLYDPGRSKHILFNGKPASEDEFGEPFLLGPAIFGMVAASAFFFPLDFSSAPFHAGGNHQEKFTRAHLPVFPRA